MHTYTQVQVSQGKGAEEKVSEKRKVFKGLTEVTEAACLYRSIATVAAQSPLQESQGGL